MSKRKILVAGLGLAVCMCWAISSTTAEQSSTPSQSGNVKVSPSAPGTDPVASVPQTIVSPEKRPAYIKNYADTYPPGLLPIADFIPNYRDKTNPNDPLQAALRGPGCAPAGPSCLEIPYSNALLSFPPFNEPITAVIIPANQWVYDDCQLAGTARFACSVTFQLRPNSVIGGPFDMTLSIKTGNFFPTCPDDPAAVEIYTATKMIPRDASDNVVFDIPAPYVQLPEFVWVGLRTSADDIFWWRGSDAETGTTRGTTITDRDISLPNEDGVCTAADYAGMINGATQENVAGFEFTIKANGGSPGFCCDRATGTCSTNVLLADCRDVLDVWSQNVDCTGNCTACPDPWALGGNAEGETTCGGDGYVDTTNAGCDGNDSFTAISCGAANARLSTSFTYKPGCTVDGDCPPGTTCNAGLCTGVDGARDSDWYQLNLTQDSVVSINVVALFPAVIELRNNGGVGANCAERVEPIKTVVGTACSTITLSETLDAGDWHFGVYPEISKGVPCGSKYRVEVECAAANLSAQKGACCESGVAGSGSCTSQTARTCQGRLGMFLGVGTTCGVEGATCPGDPGNDECTSPPFTIPSSFSTSVSFNTSFANDSTNPSAQPNCQQVPATPATIKHDVWYKFQIPTIGFSGSPGTTIINGDLVISTAGSTFDTWLVVYGGPGVNCATDFCAQVEIPAGCSDDASDYPAVVNDNPLSYLVIACDGNNGAPLPGDCVAIRVGGKDNDLLAGALGPTFEGRDFNRGACTLNIDFIPRQPAPFGFGSAVGKCCQPNGSCSIVIGNGIDTAETVCLNSGGKYRITTDFNEGGTTTTGTPTIVPEPLPESPGCVTYPCPPPGGACFNALPLNLTAGDPLFGVDFGSVTALVRDQIYYRYKVPTTPPLGIVFDTCDSNFDSVLSIYSDDNNTSGECLNSGNLIAANDDCNLSDQWYFLFPSQVPPVGTAVGATTIASCYAGGGNDACVCLPTTDAMASDSEVLICIGAFPTIPMRPDFTRPSIRPRRNPLLAEFTSVLSITAAPSGCFVCDATCPAGPPAPIQEGGPICADNPVPVCDSIFACSDPFNGGCTNTNIPFAFGSPILPCSPVESMVCGKTGAFRSFVSCNTDTDCRGTETCSSGLCTGQRSNFVDEDWYKINVTEPVRLNVRVVESEAPIRLRIIQDEGDFDCDNLNTLAEAAADFGCDPPNGAFSTPSVAADICGRPASVGGPSTYYVVIESAVGLGPSCNSEYVVGVRCDPYPGRQDCCKADMNNDAKINGLDIKKWVESFVFPAVQFDEYDGCQSLNTCRGDITNDGEITTDDILPFVNQLVVTAKPTCPPLPDQCSDPSRCQLPGGLPPGTTLSQAVERSDFDSTVDDRAAECICPTVAGNISELCWWGVYANGFLGDCGSESDCFTITFYNSTPNVKCPGSLRLAPQIVTVTRTATGEDFGGLPEFMYRATLPTPLAVTANDCVWVEIVNKTPNNSCFWWWEASGSGDDRHARHNQDPPNPAAHPTTWTCTDGADPDDDPDDRRLLDLTICANLRTNKFGCGKPVGRCCYRNAAFPGGTIICENLTEEICVDVKGGIWDENVTCTTPCPTGRCCDLPNGLGQPVRCTAPALSEECAAVNGTFTPGVASCIASPCPTGRCCDYSPVFCVVETEVECQARIGIWSGAIASCASPNTCPPSICNAFTGMGRRCWTPATSNASGWLSDEDDFSYFANNFAVTTTGTLNQVCWRGFHQTVGTPDDCGQLSTETFRLTYYAADQFNVKPLTGSILNSTAGTPAVFNVTPSRINVGNFQTSVLYTYEAFHTPVPVTAGSCFFIEIVNTTVEPSCRFWWHTSNQGDGRAASRDTDVNPNSGYQYFGSADFTMCLAPATLQYQLTACQINAPVPPNDTCVQGQAASFGLIIDTPFAGTTVGAINDAPGLDCNGNGGVGPDVYYNMTPPGSGQTTIKLCPSPPNPPGVSAYDAILEVHSECPNTGANTLGCDDDGCGAMAGPSIVTIPNLVGGTNYSVRVSGWGGSFGDFSVVFTQP